MKSICPCKRLRLSHFFLETPCAGRISCTTEVISYFGTSSGLSQQNVQELGPLEAGSLTTSCETGEAALERHEPHQMLAFRCTACQSATHASYCTLRSSHDFVTDCQAPCLHVPCNDFLNLTPIRKLRHAVRVRGQTASSTPMR